MTPGRRTTLTVGHVTHDRYPRGTRAGGSAFFGARAMRALGARSRLVSSVGNDFERFDELGCLEALVSTDGATTTFENSYDAHGRRVQRVAAVARGVTPEALPVHWRDADVLFLGPVIGEVPVLAWLDAVRAPIVGLGLQGLLKRPGPWKGCTRSLVPEPLRLDYRTLERIDVAFLSGEDLADFGSAGLLDGLRRSVRIVVLTLGREGSCVWSGGRQCRVGTFPAVAIDPTGAGDVFASAFLLALAEDARPCEAARLGAAAASIVIEAEAGSSLGRLRESRARASGVPVTRS